LVGGTGQVGNAIEDSAQSHYSSMVLTPEASKYRAVGVVPGPLKLTFDMTFQARRGTMTRGMLNQSTPNPLCIFKLGRNILWCSIPPVVELETQEQCRLPVLTPPQVQSILQHGKVMCVAILLWRIALILDRMMCCVVKIYPTMGYRTSMRMYSGSFAR
jgi:hypothetical protein